MEKEILIKKMNGEKYSKTQKKIKLKSLTTLTDSNIIEGLNLKLSYDPKWGIALVKYCSQGNSLESFCSKYHINPKQIEKWMDIDEFQGALAMARAGEIHYWEERLKEAMSVEWIDEDNKIHQMVDSDLLKICKFKLENLGYGSKLTESGKVLFQKSPDKKIKKKGIPLKAEEDLTRQTEAEIDELTDLYLGKE